MLRLRQEMTTQRHKTYPEWVAPVPQNHEQMFGRPYIPEWWHREDGRASASLKYLSYWDDKSVESGILGEPIEILMPMWEISLRGCLYKRKPALGEKHHIDYAYFERLEDAIEIAEWDLVDCEIDRHFHDYEIFDFQDTRKKTGYAV